MITIVLAEDHKIVRQGLKLLLKNQADFKLVGDAADGVQALRLVEKLKPQVLVLDLSIPECHGLDVLRHLKRSKTRTLVLSMHFEESYVLQALRNGAHGYLAKSSDGPELTRAIREVASGRKYLGEGLPPGLLAQALEKSPRSVLDPYETLTNRERTVLQLTAEGNSSSNIGSRLFISPRTAETHRSNLMRKLRLRSQTELVRYAIRRKIIPV